MSKQVFARAFLVALRQRSFVAVAVVLLVSAVGLNAATQFLQLHFKKQPVPLARPLDTVPDVLGQWVQVSRDEPLKDEIEETLGTDKYIFRTYVDSVALGRKPEDIRAEVKDKSTEERRKLLATYQQKSPAAVATLAVTYYTGMVDTVAHIPDRCYVADGYEPVNARDERWPLGKGAAGTDELPLRFITFEDQAGGEKMKKNVAYFFHCNGGWQPDPLGVRRRLQNLFEPHGYYAKVEVMNVLNDTAASRKAMETLLSSAVPEIVKCLPDWERVKGSGTKQPVAVAGR